MVIRRNRGLFIAAISLSLLAGCVSPSQSPAPSGAKASAKTPPILNQNRVEAYAHYLQGLIYEQEEKSDQAQEELAQAAMLDPSNEDLVVDLVRRYLRQKQPDKALALLTRATSVPGASGTLFAQLGLVYSQLDKEEAAVAACQNAIKVSPTSSDGYRVLFFIRVQTGKIAEARKVLEQALKVPDTKPEFVLDAVDLCAIFERQAPSEKAAITGRALAALGRAAEQEITDPHLRLRMADDYAQLGDSTNATKIYLQLLAAYGELPSVRGDVHEKLAKIYLSQNDYTNASAQLVAIVQDDPSNAQAYSLLGSLAEEQNKLQDAEDYYHKALILSAGVLAPYCDLARVQIDRNEPREALATLERARAKFADDYLLEILSAQAFEKGKDYTNAVNRYTTAEVIAKATNPKLLNDTFYFFQGAACERAGEYDQAEKCFEKSIELKPDSAEALNYLGYMWADRGQNLDKAFDLIQKALKLEPKSPAYLDSLGWVLYKLHRPQEALAPEQKAIELNDGPDATLFEHLGDIFAALRQTDKAREAWTKSLAVEPNEAIRKKLDDALTNHGPDKTPAKP